MGINPRNVEKEEGGNERMPSPKPSAFLPILVTAKTIITSGLLSYAS